MIEKYVLKDFVYLREGESMSGREREGKNRERKKQTPHRAGSPTQGSAPVP